MTVVPAVQVPASHIEHMPWTARQRLAERRIEEALAAVARAREVLSVRQQTALAERLLGELAVTHPARRRLQPTFASLAPWRDDSDAAWSDSQLRAANTRYGTGSRDDATVEGYRIYQRVMTRRQRDPRAHRPRRARTT